MLFALPTSDVGNRAATTPVPEKLLEAWAQSPDVLATAGRKRRDTPPSLRRRDGRAALEELRAAIEPHLHPDHGRYAGIADWMNKLPGRSSASPRRSPSCTTPTRRDHRPTLRDAIALGRAYVSHAVAAFGLTRPNGEVFSQARQVLATVPTAVPRRRSRQRHPPQRAPEAPRPGMGRDGDSLDIPIELLVEYGHLRRREVQPIPAGGRPSELLELHPVHLTDVAR